MVKQHDIDMILHVVFQSNILEQRFLWEEYFNFEWPRGNFW